MVLLEGGAKVGNLWMCTLPSVHRYEGIITSTTEPEDTGRKSGCVILQRPLLSLPRGKREGGGKREKGKGKGKREEGSEEQSGRINRFSSFYALSIRISSSLVIVKFPPIPQSFN